MGASHAPAVSEPPLAEAIQLIVAALSISGTPKRARKTLREMSKVAVRLERAAMQVLDETPCDKVVPIRPTPRSRLTTIEQQRQGEVFLALSKAIFEGLSRASDMTFDHEKGGRR